MSRLNANLSDDAHDGWRHVSVYGVEMTSLAEAIGLRLARLEEPEHQLPGFWRDLMAEARAIRADTKRR